MFEHDEFESTNEFLDDPEESVDLYELLGVAPNADMKRVRKRIGEMFLEAQNNVEHRSFRRRFYYRELMEVLLPKARHHLLNVERRQNYNHSLGLPSINYSPASNGNIEYSKEAVAADKTAPLTRNNDPIRPVTSAAIAPHASSPEANASTPPETISSEMVSLEAAKAEAVSSEAAQAESPKTAGLRGVTPEHLKMDASRVEQRRIEKRRELIKQELVAEGQKWGIAAGFGAFTATAFLIFTFAWLAGISQLEILAVPLALGVALFCARYAHRESRKRIIALLSQMPYDKLLQRCARM